MSALVNKRVPLKRRAWTARAHGVGWLAQALAAQFLVVDARHVDVDVDAVEQRAGDALLVARHHRRRAGALLLGVSGIAAWAGMNTKRTF
jgi:hypothetical protein